MSRTYRRKGYSRDRQSLFWDWESNEGWIKVWLDPKSKEIRKALAKYHSDSGKFMGNAPHWYCNYFERSARREAKHQLHKYMRNPEDLTFNRGFSVCIDANHRHGATWCWW